MKKKKNHGLGPYIEINEELIFEFTERSRPEKKKQSSV